MTLLAIHGGAAYHIEALEGRYGAFFDAAIRPEAIPSADLDSFNAVIVLCRTPAFRMEPHAAHLLGYLDRGGTVVAMGECHSERWLPNIAFEPCETNFWWWQEPGADLGTRIAKPGHALFRRLGEADIKWHLHGYFTPPSGTEILATGPGGPILYVDQVTTRGRMVVTSLDPFFHHGHHFMPATTRFLDGFMPWVRDELMRIKA